MVRLKVLDPMFFTYAIDVAVFYINLFISYVDAYYFLFIISSLF